MFDIIAEIVYMLRIPLSDLYQLEPITLIRFYKRIAELERKHHFIISQVDPQVVAPLIKSNVDSSRTLFAGEIYEDDEDV